MLSIIKVVVVYMVALLVVFAPFVMLFWMIMKSVIISVLAFSLYLARESVSYWLILNYIGL